jgi:peptide/nickel transport system substrate-binding protein
MRIKIAIAVTTVVALGLSACGGTGGTTPTPTQGGGDNATPAFNAGVGKVFNPSDAKGGTLKMASNSDCDSWDPQDMYFGYCWNFVRNYVRPLVTFKAAPGEASNELVPDLAESLGQSSDNAKTWTYKLRKGIKFEDGTPVTSKHVKYGIARSLDKDILPNGPTYFKDVLDLQGYEGPFKDKDLTMANFKAIETPDDNTIIFKLKTPFAGFDYLAMLPATAPVPPEKDTGTKYKEKVWATGPYKMESHVLGQKVTFTRNTNYDAASDPATGRKALPDTIEVALKVSAEDIDQRLLSGDLDIAISGEGVLPATLAQVINDPNRKKFVDQAKQARTWYTALNNDVAPLDNEHCRKAVLYAADKQGYQRAYGGDNGGDIATSMMPTQIPGWREIDLYNAKSKPTGDEAKAKEELTACGKPEGFSTVISYRAERPKEKATAEALQQSLQKVGIKTELKGFPQDDYSKLYAGKVDFAKANNLGIRVYGWGADWNDGYGFLSQIVDSRVIRAAGNTNLNVKNPDIDALLDKALQTTDKSAREKLWGDIDQKVMEGAYYLPGVWAKQTLFRPERLTNVFISDAWNMYEYTTLGVTK